MENFVHQSPSSGDGSEFAVLGILTPNAWSTTPVCATQEMVEDSSARRRAEQHLCGRPANPKAQMHQKRLPKLTPDEHKSDPARCMRRGCSTTTAAMPQSLPRHGQPAKRRTCGGDPSLAVSRGPAARDTMQVSARLPARRALGLQFPSQSDGVLNPRLL